MGRKGRVGEKQNVNDSSQKATWAKLERMNFERMETTSLKTTSTTAQMLIFVISKIKRTFQRLPLLHHTCNNVFSLPLFCICRLKIIRANNQKIELNPFEWRKYETLGLGYSISTISKLQMNTHSFSIKISIAMKGYLIYICCPGEIRSIIFCSTHRWKG